MILERLRMVNFRCYDSAVVDFASDSNLNTTVILGVNGAGKTSILLALKGIGHSRFLAPRAVVHSQAEHPRLSPWGEIQGRNISG